MIFIIIALITALVFPCALINAVTSEKNKDIWTAVSCTSIVLMIGAILFSQSA